MANLEIRRSVHEVKAYYSVIMHGRPNELMNIIQHLYSEDFKELTGDETAPPMSDSTIKHWLTKRRPCLRKSASLPLPVIMQICSEKIENDLNPIVQMHSTDNQTILFGYRTPRFRYEFDKYELKFLKKGIFNKTLTHEKYPNLERFHMELNPHMTIDFALEHIRDHNWDLKRIAGNTSIKWIDFELLMRKHLSEPLDKSYQIRHLALNYLTNPNLTAEEFKKINLLFECDITRGDMMYNLSMNLFAWHPVIYNKSIAAARQTQKELMRGHMRDAAPDCVTAAVLRYCDCI